MIYFNTPQDLGQHLKLLRKQAHLSQTNLALRANLSRTAIQAIESGKQTYQIDTLLKVLHTLNVKIAIDHPLLEGSNG